MEEKERGREKGKREGGKKKIKKETSIRQIWGREK